MTEIARPEMIEATLLEGILANERKDTDGAISFLRKAIRDSEAIGYHHGVLHGMFNMGKVWKREKRETGTEAFGFLARASIVGARDYAEKNAMDPEEVTHANFLLGQMEFELGNFLEAVTLYQGAYDFYKADPRSQAHLGDVQRHLGTAMVRAGNVEGGIAVMESGLAAIRTRDEPERPDKPNDVWETGALLALADVYSGTDRPKATALAEEALKIAKAKGLTIRTDEATSMVERLKAEGVAGAQ